MDRSTRVNPDGVPRGLVVCGEAPAREEVRQGRGFVGPSGNLLWPLLRRYANVERGECWVTNLCKHPLDNDADTKLTPEEIEECRLELLAELEEVQPTHILALGVLAAKALCPEFTKMEVGSGRRYYTRINGFPVPVIPCWHPAAVLHGGADKDPLAWIGRALGLLEARGMAPTMLKIPPPTVNSVPHATKFPDRRAYVAIDTEGTAADPLCMTWAEATRRVYVPRADVVDTWNAFVRQNVLFVFHNAVWDWAVLEAMGVKRPWSQPYVDTMEMAYLAQTEPQGLKDLALRHFDIPMRSWEQVVMPHYNEIVTAAAAGYADAETTVVTHSPKTGRPFKKPKITRTEFAKKLVRTHDFEKLAALIHFPPPTLDFVPRDEVIDYATLDAWVTYHLHARLR